MKSLTFNCHDIYRRSRYRAASQAECAMTAKFKIALYKIAELGLPIRGLILPNLPD